MEIILFVTFPNYVVEHPGFLPLSYVQPHCTRDTYTYIRVVGELGLDANNRELTSDIEFNQRLCVFLLYVRDHIPFGWWLLFIQTSFDSVGCNTKINPEGEETRRVCPQCHNGQSFWPKLKYTEINADQ